MLHHRAGRREEHTLAAVLPANQVGRCAIGAMNLDDDALTIHIADVTAFDQELITRNRAHLLPPSASGASAITLTVVSPGNQRPKVPQEEPEFLPATALHPVLDRAHRSMIITRMAVGPCVASGPLWPGGDGREVLPGGQSGPGG